MPTHWLKVEDALVGFNWHEKASCYVFYPSKNPLFWDCTMNAETHSASEKKGQNNSGMNRHWLVGGFFLQGKI